jgi:hypothetical protein
MTDDKSKKSEQEKSDELRKQLSKNAPTPRKEGPDNLTQRAEWFERRTGTKKDAQ